MLNQSVDTPLSSKNSFLTHSPTPPDPRYEYMKIGQKNVSYEQHLASDSTLSTLSSSLTLKSGYPPSSSSDFLFPSTYTLDTFPKPPTTHQLDDDIITVICSLVKVHLHRLILSSLPHMKKREGTNLTPEDLHKGMLGKGGSLGINLAYREGRDGSVEKFNERAEEKEREVETEGGVWEVMRKVTGEEEEEDNPLVGAVEKEEEFRVEEGVVFEAPAVTVTGAGTEAMDDDDSDGGGGGGELVNVEEEEEEEEEEEQQEVKGAKRKRKAAPPPPTNDNKRKGKKRRR